MVEKQNINTSKRNLLQGALWSAPVIVATSQIPSFAASQRTGSLTSAGSGQIIYNGNADGSYALNNIYRMTSIRPGRSSYGAIVYNTIPSDKITDAFVVYWLPEKDLSFTVVESNGWTTPQADASRGTYTTPEGIVEYPYISRYMGTVTAVAGNTELPSYSFAAQGISREEDWPSAKIRYRYQYSVTINGDVQSRSPMQTFYRI